MRTFYYHAVLGHPNGPNQQKISVFFLVADVKMDTRQLTMYDAADRPAPQYTKQLVSDSYSFLGLPRFFFGFCGSTAGSWKDVSEAAAGPSRSLCEGLGDEQEEAGSLLQRC